MTHARGLTMVEVLVALALLSSIALASSGWVGSVVRGADEFGDKARRERAFASLVQLIEEEVRITDARPEDHKRDGQNSRSRTRRGESDRTGVPAHRVGETIWTNGEHDLSLRGRSRRGNGPVIHRYEWDRAREVLWYSEEAADDASAPARTVREPVMTGLEDFRVELDPEQRVLRLHATMTGDHRFEREVRLP